MLLLCDAGFIKGSYGYDGVDTNQIEFSVLGMTWQGYELLDTIRSKPVWDKIKSTALEKGLELIFETVKLLGVKCLGFIVGD